MQNKGLITVFAILFGLVSLYQLSYTFIASSVEKEAKAYSHDLFPKEQPDDRAEAMAHYLDSVNTLPRILGIDYKTSKEKQLQKGLDLEGGVNVILQVSVKDILSGLTNNSKNGAFTQALAGAGVRQTAEQETYLESFFNAFEELPGENKLASPEIFFNKNLEGQIESNYTNDQVMVVLERKIDEAIESAFEVLRKRIDKFGVTQPNLQRLGTSGRILVELPGAKDVKRVTELVQKTALLEFWDVMKTDAMLPFLIAADEKVSEIIAPKKEEEGSEEAQDTTQTKDDAVAELLGGDEVEGEDDFANSNPIMSLATPQRASNPGILSFKLSDTVTINSYLRMPQVLALLTGDQRNAKFAWSIPEFNQELQEEITSLYALVGNRDDVAPLSGGVITDAQQSYTPAGAVSVTMQMNGAGAKIWEDMTEEAFKNQTQIAVVLDDIVYSAPGINNGKISGGRSEISGSFTIAEGEDLANVLRAGKLPASADIIQAEVVGPTLGQEAIDSGILSFIIALGFVLLWMIFYYGKAGAFADVALVVNILFIFGILAGLGAVLTLPGIAGIVLTIGISVDANVLIFERIREELAKGKTQRDAINDGFNNALSSILDANITTGLTGLILLVFGTGPIKGFATTLLIGICTSLFTAIFITRLFIDRYTINGKH